MDRQLRLITLYEFMATRWSSSNESYSRTTSKTGLLVGHETPTEHNDDAGRRHGNCGCYRSRKLAVGARIDAAQSRFCGGVSLCVRSFMVVFFASRLQTHKSAVKVAFSRCVGIGFTRDNRFYASFTKAAF